MPGDATVSETTEIQLPIGAAIRIRRVHELNATATPGSVASQTIGYVTILGDGRTVWLHGTAPRDDETFNELMTGVAESLVAR